MNANKWQTLAAVAARVHELVQVQHRCFRDDVQPLLAAERILLLGPKEISEAQGRFLEEYFRRTVLPVLSPLAVDPAHPFPYLGNRSLCLVASIRSARVRLSGSAIGSTIPPCWLALSRTE